MLTHEQIINAIKGGRKSRCLDGRDYIRLSDFFPVSDIEVFGLRLKEGADVSGYKPKDLTRENVIDQLRRDVAFGFEKAINRRGISASFMYEVVKMWMWVLEDDLQHHDHENDYGMSFFSAVAERYGFPVETADADA